MIEKIGKADVMENRKIAQNGTDQAIDILARGQGAWTREMADLLAEALAAKDAEIERLRSRAANAESTVLDQHYQIEQLRALVEELAGDLEAEVEGRYLKTRDHPAMTHRYERDMEPVKRAREALVRKP